MMTLPATGVSIAKLYRNINNMLDLDLKNAMINEIERKKHIISPFI